MRRLGWFVAGVAVGWLGAQTGQSGPERAEYRAAKRRAKEQLGAANLEARKLSDELNVAAILHRTKGR